MLNWGKYGKMIDCHPLQYPADVVVCLPRLRQDFLPFLRYWCYLGSFFVAFFSAFAPWLNFFQPQATLMRKTEWREIWGEINECEYFKSNFVSV